MHRTGPRLGVGGCATRGRASEGALLLGAYSAGLGLPFLGAGLAFSRLTGAFGWIKRHFIGITLASSAALGGFGVLLTLNRLTVVTSELQSGLRAIGLGRLVTLG